MGSGALQSLAPGQEARGFRRIQRLGATEPDRYAQSKRFDKYRELPVAVHPVWAIAIAEFSRVVAAAVSDISIHLWDLRFFEIKVSLRGHTDVVWALDFSPNETVLASASADRTIRLWETETGNPAGVLRTHTEGVRTLCFSPDGVLVSGGADSMLAVWEYDNNQPLMKWRAHEGPVHSVAVSLADRGTAFSIGMDGSIAAWKLETAELCGRFPGGDGGGVLALAAHPSHPGVVVTGLEDGGIWLWFFQPSAAGVAEVGGHHALKGHQKPVWTLRFSDDGSLLASGSSDQTVCVWDVHKTCSWEAGQPPWPVLVAHFKAHDSWVRSIRWLGLNRALISCSVDGHVNIWQRNPRYVKVAEQVRRESTNLESNQAREDAMDQILGNTASEGLPSALEGFGSVPLAPDEDAQSKGSGMWAPDGSAPAPPAPPAPASGSEARSEAEAPRPRGENRFSFKPSTFMAGAPDPPRPSMVSGAPSTMVSGAPSTPPRPSNNPSLGADRHWS